MNALTKRTLIAAGAIALLASCGPPWQALRLSGPPSALMGMQSLGVSFDYSQLMMVGLTSAQPEQAWLATQPPDDQASYLEVRALIESTVVSELQSTLPGIQVQPSTGQETHQLTVRPTALTMGFYRFVASQDSNLEMIFSFSTGGMVTDEIAMKATRAANMRNARITSRMEYCARVIARYGAQFVRESMSGG